MLNFKTLSVALLAALLVSACGTTGRDGTHNPPTTVWPHSPDGFDASDNDAGSDADAGDGSESGPGSY